MASLEDKQQQLQVPPTAPELDHSAKPEAVVQHPPPAEKHLETSLDRDVALARMETEKTMSMIRAWEDNEKTKAENKAEKKLTAIATWENTKKAALEAELKKIEEDFEKKKAEYGEKMKNKIAQVHKEAEEKRAIVEAQRGEQLLKAEEGAAKFRACDRVPKSSIGCFGP